MNNRQEEISVQDKASDFYENIRYKLPYSRAYHGWIFKKMINLAKPLGKILDDGCGNGYLAEFLPGYDITGVDISPKMAEQAKKRISNVMVADAENLPFENNYFDVVFARGLLHHLPDARAGVKEISRVLKQNGRAVFLDPLNSPVRQWFKSILKNTKYFSSLHKNFSRREMENLISPRLKIIKTDYVGFLGYVLLGFPDVFNFYRFFPFKKFFTPLLIKTDCLFSSIPLINRLAMGIIILAQKTND